MTLRDHYTPEQKKAAAILDAVRNGLKVMADQITWALITLGEPC